MFIQLHAPYRGRRSGERIIAAGSYAADDKRLFGLADYLVETGHARRVSGDAETLVVPPGSTVTIETPLTAEQVAEELLLRTGQTPVVPAFPEVNPAPDYDSMSLDDLKTEIERVGIDLSGVKGAGANGRLLKADLINILKGYHEDLGVWTPERWAEWDAEREALGLPPWPYQEPPGHSGMV